MSDIIGIVDEPVGPGQVDHLDIGSYAKALIKFVSQTRTPITIGIQGEWGSGKTSLLNSIEHSFENDPTAKQIWINSWEYSLLSSPEESLLKIVNRIIDELVEADESEARKDKIKKGAANLIKGALRIGTHMTLGEDAGKITGDLLSGSSADIGALRGQLSELTCAVAERDSNPYKKIIIYVDDLDRIEPKNAVVLLELLKNIFSIPNCVFILAIDYQVVVKGLVHKFGEQTSENEWEFRAFFDKIIQLPFMMPMGQYNIGKYMNFHLKNIGFIAGDGLDEASIEEIVLRTIGGNPRSLKRLVNSISLIQIFTDVKSSEDDNGKDYSASAELGLTDKDLKLLIFSLLCLQIAFPSIYDLLSINPDFTSWDDEFAFSKTGGKENQEPSYSVDFESVSKTEDFDEPWEMSLFKFCYINPMLKPRVTDISRFFSYIKDTLMQGKEDLIGGVIAQIFEQTSVTRVASTDEAQVTLSSSKRSKGYRNEEFWSCFVDVMKGQKKPLFSSLSKQMLKRSPIYGRHRGFTANSLKLAFVFRLKKEYIEGAFDIRTKSDTTQKNLEVFDYIYSHKTKIENNFEGEIFWLRREDRVSQHIAFRVEAGVAENRELWPKYSEEVIEKFVKLESALKSVVESIDNEPSLK